MTDTMDGVLPEETEKPPGTLDLFAKFALSVNDLTEQVAKANRIEQAKLDRVPNYVPLSRIVIPEAAVTWIEDFNGPQPGRAWHVRMLNALASPFAANATVVTWYVGQRMPGPAAGMLPATMARWQFASTPAFEDFGPDMIKILPGEHLIAGLTGIPAVTVMALTAVIHDVPMGRIQFQ